MKHKNFINLLNQIQIEILWDRIISIPCLVLKNWQMCFLVPPSDKSDYWNYWGWSKFISPLIFVSRNYLNFSFSHLHASIQKKNKSYFIYKEKFFIMLEKHKISSSWKLESFKFAATYNWGYGVKAPKLYYHDILSLYFEWFLLKLKKFHLCRKKFIQQGSKG